MGLRPARCYRDTTQRSYARTAKSVHKRNYVGANPAMLIRQFNMGNPTLKYDKIADLVADTRTVVRDNALEAARVAINKALVKHVGKDLYFMKIRIYPHEVLRENKQAQGAGADRISEGMSHSFGKAIGRAIRSKKGMKLISILFLEKNEDTVIESAERAIAKLPCKSHVEVHDDITSIGTLPRKTRAMIEEEKPAEAAEEKKEGTEEKKEETTKEAAGKTPKKEEKAAGKKK